LLPNVRLLALVKQPCLAAFPRMVLTAIIVKSVAVIQDTL
jgi:hypothetical protein